MLNSTPPALSHNLDNTVVSDLNNLKFVLPNALGGSNKSDDAGHIAIINPLKAHKRMLQVLDALKKAGEQGKKISKDLIPGGSAINYSNKEVTVLYTPDYRSLPPKSQIIGQPGPHDTKVDVDGIIFKPLPSGGQYKVSINNGQERTITQEEMNKKLCLKVGDAGFMTISQDPKNANNLIIKAFGSASFQPLESFGFGRRDGL